MTAEDRILSSFLSAGSVSEAVALGLAALMAAFSQVNHATGYEIVDQALPNRVPDVSPNGIVNRPFFHHKVKYALCCCRVFNANV